jgi:hypothetical protein
MLPLPVLRKPRGDMEARAARRTRWRARTWICSNRGSTCAPSWNRSGEFCTTGGGRVRRTERRPSALHRPAADVEQAGGPGECHTHVIVAGIQLRGEVAQRARVHGLDAERAMGPSCDGRSKELRRGGTPQQHSAGGRDGRDDVTGGSASAARNAPREHRSPRTRPRSTAPLQK